MRTKIATSDSHAPHTQPTQVADALQRAIDYLGAVEVAPGRHAHENSWTFEGSEEPVTCWLVSNGRRLIHAWIYYRDEIDDHEKRFGYSWWEDWTPMPAWWSPKQRTVTRVYHADGSTSTIVEAGTKIWDALPHVGDRLELVTADLETGEEIAANALR